MKEGRGKVRAGGREGEREGGRGGKGREKGVGEKTTSKDTTVYM